MARRHAAGRRSGAHPGGRCKPLSGVAPKPGPTPVLLYSVWANQEATQRPVVGQEYSTLYLKAEAVVDHAYVTGDSDQSSLSVTRSEEIEEYDAMLYVDYIGGFALDAPAGTVSIMNASEPVEITAEHVLDFYEE